MFRVECAQQSTNERVENKSFTRRRPMHECPHCNQRGISTLRKLSLGPAVPATCQACGRKVGVPWGRSLAAASPALVALLVGMFSGSIAALIVLAVVGASVSGLLTHHWVPLEARF
jgi:uncharacterized paraquat-inducible protein A